MNLQGTKEDKKKTKKDKEKEKDRKRKKSKKKQQSVGSTRQDIKFVVGRSKVTYFPYFAGLDPPMTT